MSAITNVRIYGLEESCVASGYPMRPEVYDELFDQFVFDIKAEKNHRGIEANNDYKRMTKLGNAKSGSGHDCALKGIVVQFDWKTPAYLQVQIQRYHFLDIISSQSKMHRITKMDLKSQCNEYVWDSTINELNNVIAEYNKTDHKEIKEHLFKVIISNLPQGLQLTARFTTNYLQLKTMYNQRKHHKLEEWKFFCDWCETLPYFTEFCLSKK